MQSIRIGGAAATVTVTSSTPAVGQLETTLTTGDSVTVTIPIGANSSASTVAAGGVAFDPLVQGSTTIEATIPDFITTNDGTRNVTVGP